MAKEREGGRETHNLYPLDGGRERKMAKQKLVFVAFEESISMQNHNFRHYVRFMLYEIFKRYYFFFALHSQMCSINAQSAKRHTYITFIYMKNGRFIVDTKPLLLGHTHNVCHVAGFSSFFVISTKCTI